MSIKRLLPGRWARILGWAIAGATWGTTAVAVAAGAGDSLTPVPDPPSGSDDVSVARQAPSLAVQAPLPDQPKSGLVVIRFTPVERPEARIVTRTVTVSAPTAQAPASASQSAPPVQAPAAPVTVQSSGS